MTETDTTTTYILRADGCDIDLSATTRGEARAEARKLLREGHEDADETLWSRGYLIPIGDGEEGEAELIRVQIDPAEPECLAGAERAGLTDDGSQHRWRAPHSLVGGLKENPGVQGHGGGVIYVEVCTLCGCARTTDTWAQDPTDGTQGHTSVSYEEGEYAERIERVILVELGADREADLDVASLERLPGVAVQAGADESEMWVTLPWGAQSAVERLLDADPAAASYREMAL